LLDGTWNTADYVKIDTGEGSVGIPNGLATPAPIDADGDGDIDRIYAGDLLGNLWAFDVSDANPSNWKIALPGNQALFTAKDSSNNPQIGYKDKHGLSCSHDHRLQYCYNHYQ
jgi:type IV pilus assembly protein PilY1